VRGQRSTTSISVGERRFVQLHRLRRWIGSEFLGEDPSALLELPKCLVVATEQDGDPHHSPVGLFIELVLLSQPPRQCQCGLVFGAGHGEIGESFESEQEPGSEPVLIWEQPVVVEPGEEVPPVQIHRPDERSGLAGSISLGGVVEGCDELIDVEPEVSFGIEPDRVGGTYQVALSVVVTQRSLRLPQRLAQPAPGPALVEIGPEGSGEQVAGVGSLPVEDQEREQRSRCTKR